MKIIYKLVATVLCSTIAIGSFNINTVSSKDQGIKQNEIKPVFQADKWKNTNGNVDFPVTPDNKDDWMEMESHQEMLESCTVPEDLLKQIETEDLINLVLDYPLLSDLLAYNSRSEGLSILSNNFNGIHELLSRADGANKVFNFYCKQKIDHISSEENKSYQNMAKIEFLEAILSRKDIIDKLSESEVSKLSDEVKEKALEKTENEMFSTYETKFYENLYENDALDLIDTSDIIIKEETASANAVRACSFTSTISSKNGTPVPVIIRGEELSDSQIKTANNYYKSTYPKATFLSTSTTNYNCHSYAWYNASTDNKYWIEAVSLYIKQSKLIGTKPTSTSQKAVWINAATNAYYVHSAKISSYNSSSVTVISKWGEGPLMKHNVNYSPYGTPTIKYYSY